MGSNPTVATNHLKEKKMSIRFGEMPVGSKFVDDHTIVGGHPNLMIKIGYQTAKRAEAPDNEPLWLFDNDEIFDVIE